MKIIKVFSMLIMSSMMLTGCTSSETPEQLLSTPDYNSKLKNLSFEINTLLAKESGYSLVLPKNSTEVASINKVDLNNDSKDEIVFFQQKQNADTGEKEYGFSVVRPNNKNSYEMVDTSHVQQAQDIDYANFYDIDNDGNKEIIISYRSDEYGSIIKVYKLENNKINEVPSVLRTNKKFGTSNSTETKIKIGHLDNDNILDIVLLTYDKKTKDLIVSLANYKDEAIQIVNNQKIENVKNLNTAHISIENVQKNKKGLVMDVCKEGDMYYNYLMVKDKGELKNASQPNDILTVKSYYIPPEDINNDGVIDIPTLQNVGSFSSKSSRFVDYYHWNGEVSDKDSIKFTQSVYYNYTYNFLFRVPDSISHAIFVKEESKIENTYYDFEYYDRTGSNKLFSIGIVRKKTLDENKGQPTAQDKDTINIGSTDEYNFVAVIHNKYLAEKHNITADTIKKCFKNIY